MAISVTAVIASISSLLYPLSSVSGPENCFVLNESLFLQSVVTVSSPREISGDSVGTRKKSVPVITKYLL